MHSQTWICRVTDQVVVFDTWHARRSCQCISLGLYWSFILQTKLQSQRVWPANESLLVYSHIEPEESWIPADMLWKIDEGLIVWDDAWHLTLLLSALYPCSICPDHRMHRPSLMWAVWDEPSWVVSHPLSPKHSHLPVMLYLFICHCLHLSLDLSLDASVS